MILICSRKVLWRTLLLSDNSESPRHRLKDHKHDLQHSPLAESLHQWSVYHTCEMTEADGVPCRRLYNGCSLAERTSITRLNLSSIRCKSSLDQCPSGTLWQSKQDMTSQDSFKLYWQWQASTYLQWVVGVQVFTGKYLWHVLCNIPILSTWHIHTWNFCQSLSTFTDGCRHPKKWKIGRGVGEVEVRNKRFGVNCRPDTPDGPWSLPLTLPPPSDGATSECPLGRVNAPDDMRQFMLGEWLGVRWGARIWPGNEVR